MKTDCKTRDGITIGLIDSLITICRVLTPRLNKLDTSVGWFPKEVKEALIDLYEDKDVQFVLTRLTQSPYVEDKDQYRKLLSTVTDYIRENKIPIKID